MTKTTDALKAAAKQFRDYERSHLAKETVEGTSKARVNARMALMMEQALMDERPALPKQDRKFRFGLINRVSGEAIPEDEPVFIFRARDLHALPAIRHYRELVVDDHHRAAIDETIEAFVEFSQRETDRMKEPGITHHFQLKEEKPTITTVEQSSSGSDLVKGVWSDGEITNLDMRNYPPGTLEDIRGWITERRFGPGRTA